MKKVVRHESNEQFFERMHELAQKIDRGESVQACEGFSFEDLVQMKTFLSALSRDEGVELRSVCSQDDLVQLDAIENSGVERLEEIELEPCPFCYPHVAGDEYPPTIKKEIDGSKYWCVWAPCCDFFGPLHLTPQEAAAAWNRRGLVSQVTGKEVVDTFEKILAKDPQAILENSVVYSVTQEELLEFVAQMAPKQARDAIATLTRRLKAEREGVEEYKLMSSQAVTALEQELADVSRKLGVDEIRAKIIKSLNDKNRNSREQLEEIYLAFTRFLFDVRKLASGEIPAESRSVLSTMEAEMEKLMRTTHEAIEYPMPLDT